MQRRYALLGSALAGAVVLALALPALAQQAMPNSMVAPDYNSGTAIGPTSEGRPGVKFFNIASQAFKKGDYAHAVDMFKVSASWAYKPAQYDLGLMYFRGNGVPVDKPLGAAWMILAAERGTPQYVKARDLMVTALSKAQFERTDELWGQLKKTYGDKVALRRAKAQWALVKNQQTGSHMGHATAELRIGARNTGTQIKPGPAMGAGASGGPTISTGFGLMQSGSVPGSVAYQQFQQSDNPYSPVFLKHNSGKVKVEPLQQLKPKQGSSKPAPAESVGTQPKDS